MNRHNRIYTVLLIVLAFFYGVSIISMTFMSRSPTVAPESRWVFQMTACINAAFVAAMIATLVLRAVAPGAGCVATKALNIIMLVLIPFGTALGIYGLLKVDRDGQPARA
jgi:hypothetical protein